MWLGLESEIEKIEFEWAKNLHTHVCVCIPTCRKCPLAGSTRDYHVWRRILQSQVMDQVSGPMAARVDGGSAADRVVMRVVGWFEGCVCRVS